LKIINYFSSESFKASDYQKLRKRFDRWDLYDNES